MAVVKESKITPSQILLPVSVISVVLLVFMAFQTSQIMLEREALHQAKSQQDKPLEEATKVQQQFSALALGTKKLAGDGDKDAALIVDRLKQIGIVFGPQGAPAAAPAATAPTAPSESMAPKAAPAAVAPAAEPAATPDSTTDQ